MQNACIKQHRSLSHENPKESCDQTSGYCMSESLCLSTWTQINQQFTSRSQVWRGKMKSHFYRKKHQECFFIPLLGSYNDQQLLHLPQWKKIINIHHKHWFGLFKHNFNEHLKGKERKKEIYYFHIVNWNDFKKNVF